MSTRSKPFVVPGATPPALSQHNRVKDITALLPEQSTKTAWEVFIKTVDSPSKQVVKRRFDKEPDDARSSTSSTLNQALHDAEYLEASISSAKAWVALKLHPADLLLVLDFDNFVSEDGLRFSSRAVELMLSVHIAADQKLFVTKSMRGRGFHVWVPLVKPWEDHPQKINLGGGCAVDIYHRRPQSIIDRFSPLAVEGNTPFDSIAQMTGDTIKPLSGFAQQEKVMDVIFDAFYSSSDSDFRC